MAKKKKLVTRAGRKTWPRRLCSPLHMGCREKGQPGIVIDGDRVMEYVGIGWVDLRVATAADRRKYPRLV